MLLSSYISKTNYIESVKNWINNKTIEGLDFFGDDTGLLEIKNNIMLVFDRCGIVQDVNATGQSNVTTHYAENNVFVNDHVAHAPKIFTMSGLVGEVVFKPPHKLLDKIAQKTDNRIKSVINKLSPLTLIAPPVGNITQMAINTARYVEESAKRYLNIIADFTNIENNQSYTQYRVYKTLEDLRLNNTFVSGYTNYFGFFNNYLITSVNMRSDATTQYMSTVEITLQEWRFVGVQTTKIDTKKYKERAAAQRTKEADNGKASSIRANVSLLKQGINSIRNLFNK